MNQMINLSAPFEKGFSLQGRLCAFFRKAKSDGRIFFFRRCEQCSQCGQWIFVSPVLVDGSISRNGQILDLLFFLEEVEIVLQGNLGIQEIKLAEN